MAVNEFGAERHLLLGSKVTKLRSDHVGRNASLNPFVITNFAGGIVKLLCCTVQELKVILTQLAVLLGFPKLAQGEIAESFIAGIAVRCPMHHREKQVTGGFEVR